METPSSIRRVTRSQALVAQNSNTNNIPLSRKNEDSEKAESKSRPRNGKQQQDRSALIDITNDSPIVGLAMGSLETPSSAIVKQRSFRAKNTPGSGEALLRGQVKTLLQQVEEEAELSKITLESRPLRLLQGITGNSSMGLLAPTPANTPQVSDLSVDASGSNNGGVGFEKPSPLIQEQLISQGKNQESLESQKSIISRSLLLDFSEKSEVSSVSSECSSVITEIKEKSSPDDDSASIWSIQVNASTHDEDEEEVAQAEEEEEEDYYLNLNEGYEIEEHEQDRGYDLDELCDGINNICVDEKKMIPKFAGKHTRFVYDSEDDIEIVEEDFSAQSPDSGADVSPSALRLKGLPTPKGKHMRFLEEEN
ncbi:PREDICTED: ribosome quality control complex subunit 2 isoform X2 [Prunus mume]|uniref:Ribosome quality control complex subunit 2 isoform X2 n=1 Tax=Prunus mume TaxID=102107 RepID=A0ABM0PMR1_PRUMU|nr:PREDICTED: ribosome quality control complex subunit 2 isoform X2 [Prunus mume]